MSRTTRARPAAAERGALTLGDRTRSYLTVRCRDDADRPPALVLMLHGTLQTAASIRPFAGYGFDAYATSGWATVVYPDALRRDWNSMRSAVMLSRSTKSVDDVGFLATLIDHHVTHGGVDPTRVFVIGFSLGGQMVLRLVHEIPDLLAGAAVIGSTLPVEGDRALDRDARVPVPFLSVHGTADPLAPYTGGAVGVHGYLGRGEHLSAPDTARYFAARNGITDGPVTSRLPHRTDPGRPTSVTRDDWTGAGAAPVRAFTVHGGGHVIPNAAHVPVPWFWGPSTRDVDAAAVIADFFHLVPERPRPGEGAP